MSTDNQRQVVFIDSRVPDIQDLLAGLQPGEEAFVLDPSRDGLQQIADILAANNLTDLASISIVSHGETGEVQLGSSLVADGNLADHSAALAAIGAALGSGGTIQLYGCDVARAPAGQQFINDFSALAGGVAVEAATHAVGSDTLGASWTLDASSTAGAAPPAGPLFVDQGAAPTGSGGLAPAPAAATATSTSPTTAPFTASALANFPGQLAVGPTGQLFFRINQGNDVQLGAINNTGNTATHNSIYFGGGDTSGRPQNISVFNGNETSVAVDTAAGLVFSVGIGNNGSFDAFSVHNLNTGALISTTEFGPNTGNGNVDDVVQALTIDPFTHTLYVGDWGTDATVTGVRTFTYDPLTGALTAHGFLFTAAQTETTPGDPSTSRYTNANAFFLDTTNHLLYYVDDDTGFVGGDFHPTNAVYVVSTNGPTFSPIQLTSSTQFPTANQNLAGHDQFIGPNGSLLGLAVDVAHGIVYFETTDDASHPGNIALWWVNTTGANQTATQINLAAAGVSLSFSGQTDEGGDAAGLTFDPSTRQLYLSNADNSTTTPDLGRIFQLQLDGTGHNVTLVNTYDTAQLVGATPATVNSFDAPSTTTFDILPTLVTTGTANAATEQSAAVTLLSATPSVTDPDGDHLASASVQITGGTFTSPPSDESSAADDHLSFNGLTSGVAPGTNITISYNSSTETLTLTGYDTLSHYATVLSEVQYNTTGDNPTNYGSNAVRTITWQVNDGVVGNPSGPNTTTTTLTVIGVNDPPTFSNVATSASFTEGGAAVTLSGAASVFDPDNLNLASATVSIAAGTFVGDGDVLGFSTAGTVIAASYNSSTETLVLTGSDTLAHYRQVLDSVTFNSTSDNPTDFGSSTTRQVTWVLNDGSGSFNLSTAKTTTVSVTAVNDPPTLTGTTNASFTENGSAVVLSPNVTVSDPDNLTLASATVKITGGTFVGDGDVLSAVTATTGIVASYDSVSETLTLSGSDTLAHYQQVLDSVTFSSTSDNPNDFGSQTTRTVNWTLNDGSGSNATATATSTIGVTAINDPPTLSNVATIVPYLEGTTVPLSNAASVSDPDSLTLAGATVSIIGGTFAGDGDVLSVNGLSNGTIVNGAHVITVSYDTTSETLVLSGSDTLADYQAALDQVLFDSTSNNPDQFGLFPSRTVTWQLNDGSALANQSIPATTTVNIIAVNDPPTLSGTTDASFTENAATAVTLSGAASVSDPDSLTLASATVALTGGTFAGDGDFLAATPTGSISVSYDSATERLILTGTDTLANYRTVLDSVTFTTASDNPTDFSADPTRTVTWTLNDGSSSNAIGIATSTISVTAINDPPTVAVGATITVLPAVVTTLSPSVAVSDPDSLTLASATVAVTGGTFVGDGDVLAATTAGTGITASYDSNNERLILSGVDTLAHYEQVLESVTFDTTAADPTNGGADRNRTVTWVVDDGGTTFSTSSAVLTDVEIQQGPGIVKADVASFTENGAPSTLSPNVTLTDTHGTVLVGATVALTSTDLLNGTFAPFGQLTGDVLAANTAGTGIAASYDSTTETLVLSGLDTLDHYSQVLSSVTFSTPSDNPTDYGSDPTRLVTWTLDDGAASDSISTATSTINITAVNDPPTLAVATSAAYTENGAATTLSPAVLASDVDNLTWVGATVHIAGGTFAGDGDILAADTIGTAIAASYDSTTETLVLSGIDTLADYQQVLDSVSFFSTSDNPDDFGSATSRTITWQVDDGSSSNDLSAPVTTTVSITAINDAPTLSGAADVTYTENGAAVTLAGAASVSDPDSLKLASATVAITGGTFAGDGDVLNVVVAGTSITGVYNAVTETLVLTGLDTVAHYNQVLDGVTFGSVSDNPTNFGADPTRTIVWTLNDGSATTATTSTTTTVSINPINDPPTLAGTPASVSFTEKGGPVTLASAASVSDPDNQTLASATVAIVGGALAGDVLAAATAGTGIAASYNSIAETLVLSGSDTLAHYQQVLDSVTFNSTSLNPTNFGADPGRSVAWTLNDGSASSPTSTVTTTINLTAVNDPPILAGLVTAVPYTENAAGVTLAGAASVSDPDSANLASATVAITGGTFAGDGDVLSLSVAGTNITANYNAATERLVLTGSDTLAHYSQVLDSVTFGTTSDNPTNFGAAPSRTLVWTLNDGSNASSSVTTTVNITAINDPPTLAGTAASVSFKEKGGAVTLSGAAAVSDPDNQRLASATVAIVAGAFAGDVLATSTVGTSITASYNSTTERLTLTGSDTLAHYQQVLDAVTFNSTSLNPTDFGSDLSRRVVWTINDGSASSPTASATTTVNVTAVNDPPTLSSVPALVSFHIGRTVTLATNLSLADPDNQTLASATVKITGGTFAGDGDVLATSTAGTGITASYNSTTETLVLTGSDTLADYQQVLDRVTFSSGLNPSNGGVNRTRTVTWSVNDGSATNNLATATTTIAIAPSVKNDFNGDQLSDLLFQDMPPPDNTGGRGHGSGDPNAGTPQIWLYNGTSPTSQVTLPNPGASWQIVGTGDFNGDGDADIVWQNTDGTPLIWTMNGTSVTGVTMLPDPGASWHLVGTGDFNNDGNSDLVFQNTVDGTPLIWMMSGTSVASSATLGAVGATTRIVGTGDFNGDGKSDLLFQAADGTPVIWTMNGSIITAGVALPNPGATTRVVGMGDFDGDGKSDLLLQASDGTPVIWTVSGTTLTAGVALPNPGPTWQAIGTDDFNGDGKADILFQSTIDGSPLIWTTNNLTVATSTILPSPGLNYHANTG